jgi:hypothetical protein
LEHPAYNFRTTDKRGKARQQGRAHRYKWFERKAARAMFGSGCRIIGVALADPYSNRAIEICVALYWAYSDSSSWLWLCRNSDTVNRQRHEKQEYKTGETTW